MIALKPKPLPAEPRIVPTLARAIAAFDRRNPFLRTQEGAIWRCCDASESFCSMVPGARSLFLWGSRRHFPNRIDGYPSRDPGFCHQVVEIRGLAIDWTRRQLDPRAPHPFVQPIADTRREWIHVGRSWHAIGLD